MRRFALVLALLFALPFSAPASGTTAANRGQLSVDRLPMWFEPNVGQAPPEVRFIGFSAGYQVLVTANDAVVVLPPPPGALRRMRAADRLHLTLAGGSFARTMRGERRLPGVTNEYRGNDPSQWHIGIPQYRGVRIENVYDGIDLVLYGNPASIEYDFVLRPGADARQIRLHFEGADSIVLDRSGELVLGVGGQALRQRAPIVYQEVGGARVNVAAALKRAGAKEFAFALGHYDRSRQLVIDPVLVNSSYFGNCGYTEGNAVAVDMAGNSFIAGETLSNPLLSLEGEFWEVQHPFVWKLSADGQTQMFTTRFGPSPGDGGYGVAKAVAIEGSYVYVTGATDSPGFPTTAGALQKTIKGTGWPGYPFEGFVAKLDASTGAIIYSTYLGGTEDDEPFGIAASNGKAIVAGRTKSPDFPVTSGAFQSTKGAAAVTESDGFVAELSSDGSALVYSSFLGGSLDDEAKAVAADANGRAFVCGTTWSTNFPLKNAAQPLIGGTGNDAFVTVVAANGSAIDYSTFLGGSGGDWCEGIALLPSGRIFIAGTTLSDFPGASRRYMGNGEDAFAATLEPPNWTLGYAMFLGGNGRDWGEDIAVDSGGNAYVIGETESTNFPVVHGLRTSNKGSFDVFVTKISSTGQNLVYSTYIGGTQSDSGLGIAVDPTRRAHITGGVDHDPNASTGDPQFLLLNPIAPTYFTGTAAGFITRIGITKPDPPVIGTPTAGNKRASIAFSAPPNDGGDPVTAYAVTCNPGAATVTGTASPLTLTGLTNGTTYTCSVTATNFAGTSDPSATVNVKPTMSGDTNGDDAITVGDIFCLISSLFTGGTRQAGTGDVNGDGFVDVRDVFYFINHIFASGPGPQSAPVVRPQSVGQFDGKLRVGSADGKAGSRLVLPVVVSGIDAIGGVALQIRYPAKSVQSITIRRAGALSGGTTLFEASPRTGDSQSYVLALRQPVAITGEALIAEVEVELATQPGPVVTLALDRNNTAVSSGERTVTASSGLEVEDGLISVSHGRRRTTDVR